jgi:hypothetical protein
MIWRTYGAEKTAYPRAADPRIFVNGTTPKSVGEVIKEGIVLRSVVTKRRHQLFLAGPIAASDEGFTQVIVMALLDMDRVPFALKRVSERQAV